MAERTPPTSPAMRAFVFRSITLMDRDYAGWAIQNACGLVPLTGGEQDSLRHSRELRDYHLTMPELADRTADVQAVQATHDALIAGLDCVSCKRFGRCPATSHLHATELPHAA